MQNRREYDSLINCEKCKHFTAKIPSIHLNIRVILCEKQHFDIQCSGKGYLMGFKQEECSDYEELV